jgi:hypothetical protein
MARFVRILFVLSLAMTGALSLDRMAEAADYDYVGMPAGITPFDSRYRRVQRYLDSSDLLRRSDSGSSQESDSPNHITVLKEYLKMASRFEHVPEGKDRDGAVHGDPSDSSVRNRSSRDYWQLPQETESRGTGDCEDKAIWLYARLIQIGFENVRLVVGKYRVDEPAYHAWVVHNSTGKTYILDPTINDGLWDARRYPKGFYQPLYSYSKDKRWRHSEGYRYFPPNSVKNRND